MCQSIQKVLPILLASGLSTFGQGNRAEVDLALDSVVLRPGERQLFLDDFILGDLNGATRVIHQPRKHGTEPVLRAVTGDQVRAKLTWPGKDLAELSGQRVRVRFHLNNADLYSFWLEP